jgi:pimeloyl-ACP methyl ester carboxylesterase
MLDEVQVEAGVNRQFVSGVSPTAPRIHAGGYPCQGMYYTPKGNDRPRVAFIATHYNVDFSEHYFAPYVTSRGFGFLGWNTRFRGAEDLFRLEHALIDIGVGVKWLREQAGVEIVVILGNSGGGSLMAAYQSEATRPELAGDAHGVTAESLQALLPADFYISSNAHIGRPEVMTDWMDASVVDEWDPVLTEESLNPFNPDNGPPYTPEFVERYRAAQQARNQRITDWAKAELVRINAAGIPDRLFPLFRMWGDLRFMDPSLDPSDRKPRSCYRGDPEVSNRSPSIGRACMLTTWLSMWSLETSRCRGAPHLAKLEVPALVMQGTGDTGVFPSDARNIHAAIGSTDKSLELIAGAHYFEDSIQHRHDAADLVNDWLKARI